MSKLLDLSKKYGFEVDNNSIIVPANMETEEILWLHNSGYKLTFNLSPWAYAQAQEIINKSKEKED